MALDNPEPKAAVMSDILAVVIHALSIERQSAEVTLSVDQLGQHIVQRHRKQAVFEPCRKTVIIGVYNLNLRAF